MLPLHVTDGDGVIGEKDLSAMFHSSSMLGNDQTAREVVDTFGDTTPLAFFSVNNSRALQ